MLFLLNFLLRINKLQDLQIFEYSIQYKNGELSSFCQYKHYKTNSKVKHKPIQSNYKQRSP